MKKRVPSSLIVFLILGSVFFGTSALTVWYRFSNIEFTKIESSKNQAETSSPKTNEGEKRKANLKGPSWDYHNPKIGDLIVELNKRIQEEDEREIKLEEKYTLISQTENRLNSLKEEILKLKESMQALPQEEKTNTMDAATIKRYLEIFKNLDPDEISLILDSKTNEEIGLIWASMKEGDIAELMKYWATERPNETNRFKIIMEAYEKASKTQPLNP